MSEINITNKNFESEVIISGKSVLLDFWAPWCGPCRMLSPIIAEISEEYPEIKVCKVNVDEEIEIASAYQIASIPTIMIVKNGRVVSKTVGFQSKEQLLKMIAENIR